MLADFPEFLKKMLAFWGGPGGGAPGKVLIFGNGRPGGDSPNGISQGLPAARLCFLFAKHIKC